MCSKRYTRGKVNFSLKSCSLNNILSKNQFHMMLYSRTLQPPEGAATLNGGLLICYVCPLLDVYLLLLQIRSLACWCFCVTSQICFSWISHFVSMSIIGINSNCLSFNLSLTIIWCTRTRIASTIVIIIIISAPLTIVSEDQWGDLECLYKACLAARTDGGLFTDTGEDEWGENERQSENDREMKTVS